jgi:hypothetical protein
LGVLGIFVSYFSSKMLQKKIIIQSGLVLFVNHSRNYVLEKKRKFEDLVDDAKRHGLISFIKAEKSTADILEDIYLAAIEHELAKVVKPTALEETK